MSTSITLDMITANFTKRGIKWRYYKTRADALTHNRNGAGNNINATPGGWGPIRGLFFHNFASDISDSSSLDYLYRGDAARDLPGPLSQFGLEDDGEWVVIGWGASNHASAGDAKVEALARADKMPLDKDLIPNANNLKTLLAPFYLGVEMLYGNNGPTAAQRTSAVKGGAAIMEVLGYTGGSVVMHRETHTTRSDPQFMKGYEIRKGINAQLAGWAKPVTPPTPPTTPTTPSGQEVQAPDIANPSVKQIWSWDGITSPSSVQESQPGNKYWAPGSYLKWGFEQDLNILRKIDEVNKKLDQVIELLKPNDTTPTG